MRIGKIVLAAAIAAVLLGGNGITAEAAEASAPEKATSTDALVQGAEGGVDTNQTEGMSDKNNGGNADSKGNVGNTDNKGIVGSTDTRDNAGDIEDTGSTGSMGDTDEPEEKVQHVTVLDGVDYSAVYDYDYYVTRYPDIAAVYKGDETRTLWHFVNFGMKEARRGNETFDINSYRNQYQDLRVAYGTNYQRYYMHYVNFGSKENRVATGVDSIQNPVTVKDGVNYAPVYDYFYYIQKYPDIAAAYKGDDVKTLWHFTNFGMNEKRVGNDAFDVDSYIFSYVDLRNVYGLNTGSYYKHYAMFGSKEGRTAKGVTARVGGVTSYAGVDYSAVFDADYYFTVNKDVRRAYGWNNDIVGLIHFIKCGMNEGRQASENFDVKSYRNAYDDVRHLYRNDYKAYYQHYMKYGKNEGRTAVNVNELKNPLTIYSGIQMESIYDYYFDIKYHPDVYAAFGDDDISILNHFVKYGLRENRIAKADYDKEFYKEMQFVMNERSNFTLNGRKYHMNKDGNITSWFGIDISAYNGDIDWDAVKNDGVEFVIIRAGFRGYGTFKLAEDKRFMQNLIGANKAGIKVGVYFFTEAINETEAQEEAQFVVNLIKNYGGKVELPIFVDTEAQYDEDGNLTRHSQLDPETRTKVVAAFCQKVKSLGYTPGYYAGYYWPLYPDALTEYMRWFPHYPSDINQEINLLDKHGLPYKIWQYTSSGRVKGINSYVDMNIWYN